MGNSFYCLIVLVVKNLSITTSQNVSVSFVPVVSPAVHRCEESAWLCLLNDLLVDIRVRSPDAFVFFCCEDVLLVHAQLVVYQNLRSLSTEVVLKQWSSVSAVARASGVLPFHSKIWHLSLLNFIMFTLAHSSSLLRPLQMVALPLSGLTFLPVWGHL